MLRTRITEKFGIDYPIMSAPMGMHSSSGIAAAVSNAGALGLFGAVSAGGPDWLRAEIRKTRELTDRPFGVGFITHLFEVFPTLLDVALEEKVPVVTFSFQDPAKFAAQAKNAGAKVICQVQSMKAAREAVAAGADVLVAQGNEAGGHTGTMNLLPLLNDVVEAYPDIPVMAAGGIASGRALASVLAAGADGAWLGTAFLATRELTDVSDAYKKAIVDSAGEDTVYTSVFDIIQVKAMGIPPWPKGIAERVRRNDLIDRWHGREDALRESVDDAIQELAASRERGDSPVLMGQGAGAITTIRSAAEVVESICGDAERILRERAQSILGFEMRA
jgi:nitronate monooxygenase